MPNALIRQPHDIGVYHVPPQSPTDARVRLAEEDGLQSVISAYFVAKSKISEWISVPNFLITERTLKIAAKYKSQAYPVPISLDASIVIPPLATKEEVVKRSDNLYLIVFGAISGQEHDPSIGQIAFDYFDDQIPAQLKSELKENAKRIRAYYCLVLSSVKMNVQTFLAECPLTPIPVGGEARLNGDREISFSLDSAGKSFGNAQIYAVDPNLVENTPYPIVFDLIEVVEIATISRIQNLEENGYVWGFRGEEPLTLEYSIRSLVKLTESDKSTILQSALNRIISGKGPYRKKAVLNLIAGNVAGNLGRPGEPAASPNGSFSVANGQRISFLNSIVLQNEGARVLTSSTDGAGNALLTIGLDTNVPSGTYFSERALDHKVFDQNGLDQASFGTFLNLGQSGALIWQASVNSTIKPGNIAYFNPAIRYPAGSGFNIPFDKVEMVWKDGIPIDPANIRMGFVNDLTEYQNPVSDDFIIVFDTGRSGILYILKRVSITTNALGVATIPESSKGCFAWIQGVSGRIDSPVKTGLQANSSYDALIYHVPTAIENWQVQVSYADYGGLGDQFSSFLNDAVIMSNPVLIATTQGGGSTVFVSDASIRHSPIGMHLPSIENSDVPMYGLDAPIRFSDEQNTGSLTTRMLPIIPGMGVLPMPGTVLKFIQNPGIGTGKNINGVIQTREGFPVGFRSNILHSKVAYLTIFAVIVRNNGLNRLLIATKTTRGGEDILFDSDSVAFDLFEV
jgi:hypothetical protein